MSRSRRTNLRILGSAAARRWRTNLADLDRALALLESEVAALAAELAAQLALPRRAWRPGRSAFQSAESPSGAVGGPDAAERLFARAGEVGMRQATPDFTARVLLRLPAAPLAAPVVPVAHPGPFAQLAAYLRVVGGTLGFSALLMFGSSFMLALANPGFAFAVLAALVSLALAIAASLRIALTMASGVAANPILAVTAMAAPLVTFILVLTQAPRLASRLLREA